MRLALLVAWSALAITVVFVQVQVVLVFRRARRARFLHPDPAGPPIDVTPHAMTCGECGLPIFTEDEAIESAKRWGQSMCLRCATELDRRERSAGIRTAVTLTAGMPVNTCPECGLTFDKKSGPKGHYINGICPRSAEAAPIFAEDLRDLLDELEGSDDGHP